MSVSSDECEPLVEANMWHCLSELAYHHESGWCVVGKLGVDICCPTVCGMFAVMVTLVLTESVEKFTCVLARVMSKRHVAFCEDEALLAQDLGECTYS